MISRNEFKERTGECPCCGMVNKLGYRRLRCDACNMMCLGDVRGHTWKHSPAAGPIAVGVVEAKL